jgi:RHS repeat-associated protein
VSYACTLDTTTSTLSYEIKNFIDYFPSGKVLRAYIQGETERYLLTGKERDVESGYDNFDARKYDSEIHRWLSPDPLSSEFPEWSPYNFNFSNPIRFIDPTGKSPIFSGEGENVERGIQGVTAFGSATLIKSEIVRRNYIETVKDLNPENAAARTEAKMRARANTPAIMKAFAEKMRPSSEEALRVTGTANKTNVGVNNLMKDLGTSGKMGGGAVALFSGYNIINAEDRARATAQESAAIIGAIGMGEAGAQIGAGVGALFGGVGAIPGALIGGIIGSITGGIWGSSSGGQIYDNITQKSDYND